MKFIDLDRQYDVIGKEIEERMSRVIKNKSFIMGPEITELESKLAEYVGRKHAITCASGTDALVIPLMAYELKRDDAVFVPAFTFYASAESIVLGGATPVFVDCDDSYNMDVKNLKKQIQRVLEEKKLTPRGIIPVDLFGQPADYDEIMQIAKEYNLFVLEDAAQGFGGVYKGRKACSFGDVSATSFFPAKPLGCYGDGGAIFIDNDELAEKMRSIRVHGMGSNRYNNIRMGMNGRMDTLQAAVVIPKLAIFDEELEKRNYVAGQYKKGLEEKYITPVVRKNKVSSWAQFSLLAKDKQHREEIIKKMKEKDVPIMIYYPTPLHLQTAFAYLEYDKGSLPHCEEYADKIFSIPMHPYLTDQEIEYICGELISMA